MKSARNMRCLYRVRGEDNRTITMNPGSATAAPQRTPSAGSDGAPQRPPSAGSDGAHQRPPSAGSDG